MNMRMLARIKYMKQTKLNSLSPHRNLSCRLAALCVMLTVFNLPAFTYTNFSSTGGLNLVGSAAQNGTVLRLTPAAQVQEGHAWATNKQQCAAGFDTTFQFRISNPGSNSGTPSGGDGILFMVQNIGPTDSGPIANGYVCVFFNTFLNWPGCTDYTQCDVSDNSVGVLSSGLYVAQADLTPLGINLKGGTVHSARIAFDGSRLTVWLDGATVLTNVLVPGMAPAVDATGNAWVGFGAGTGNAWEDQDILSWSFFSTPPSITSQPQSQVGYLGQSVVFNVSALGDPPLHYQWLKDVTPIGGATGSSLVLTNLQFTNAGNYSVVVTNSFGSTTSSNAYLTVNSAGVSVALYSGITIDAAVGLTYGIQYTTNLNHTNGWRGLTNVTLSGATGLWVDPQPATLPQRYYRVVPGPITIP
jgi:hypothetical protein